MSSFSRALWRDVCDTDNTRKQTYSQTRKHYPLPHTHKHAPHRHIPQSTDKKTKITLTFFLLEEEVLIGSDETKESQKKEDTNVSAVLFPAHDSAPQTYTQTLTLGLPERRVSSQAVSWLGTDGKLTRRPSVAGGDHFWLKLRSHFSTDMFLFPLKNYFSVVLNTKTHTNSPWNFFCVFFFTHDWVIFSCPFRGKWR